MAARFAPKPYQTNVLNTLADFLKRVQTEGAAGAFRSMTGRNYVDAPDIAKGTPYVCLRVPTGGGKTLIAADSIAIVARELMQTAAPMVIWLVPTDAIRSQTVKALKDREHPYRAAIAEQFRDNLTVMELDEAQAMSRADTEGGATIIVASIQAFRVEETDIRKVYEQNGTLEPFMSGLKDIQLNGLATYEGTTKPVPSFANVVSLHRPLIIVDEAHNVRGDLSFAALARLNPAMILEMTATPETNFDAAKGKVPSNILTSISAAELKAADMIKMPVRLRTREGWHQVVGDALDCQKMLEERAKLEEQRTKEYIRPIILFQAESKHKTLDRITPDVLKAHLMDVHEIPENHINIATGTQDELQDDLLTRASEVRYIITVQKLREGWDCPFAYILCSVAELSSARAIEQILGRVLRLPNARKKTQDDLNAAYAFVTSSNFTREADALKDGLVQSGFERLEAEALVSVAPPFSFYEAGQPFQSEPLPAEAAAPAFEQLPQLLRDRLKYDTGTRTITVAGQMSMKDRNLMLLAAPKDENTQRVIERLYRQSNYIEAAAPDTDKPEKPVFIVPKLGIWVQGRLEEFSKDHFTAKPWQLHLESTDAVLQDFAIDDDAATSITIDIDDQGKVKWNPIQLHNQLNLVVREPHFTIERLVNYLDRQIPHPNVSSASATKFIWNALDQLMKTKGYTLDELVRHRPRLRLSLAKVIHALELKREAEGLQTCLSLKGADAPRFETSADIGHIFEATDQIPRNPFQGAREWDKHLFDVVDDLKSTGEEYRCASHIDAHPKIRNWVRNVERAPNAFWLQGPHNKFYPDFICLLHDGRYLLVEYKGGDRMTNEDSTTKQQMGKLWQDASNGAGLFVMPTNNDLSVIDAAIGKG